MYPFRTRSCNLSWSVVKYCHFSTSSVCYRGNHYSNLQIGKDATQTEIKAAYYKMSKIYHPDKNKGSADAANRFREITAAYEVLGNIRTRKLYDRGLSNVESVYESPSSTVDEPYSTTDNVSGFHQTRHTKKPSKIYSGRTETYNFDEWTRAHYSHAFNKVNDTREKVNRLRKEQESLRNETEGVAVTGTIFVFFTLLILYQILFGHSEFDNPALIKNQKKLALTTATGLTAGDTEDKSDPKL
uniref:DnaJ homolog subfamily C member 30 n=1 Tax=Cacopsylla melanoneura TaxID=428564 RepID=A0A8D8U384_9HEMI